MHPVRLFKCNIFLLKKKTKKLFLNSSLTSTVPLISDAILQQTNGHEFHFLDFVSSHLEYYILTNALFFVISSISEIKQNLLE
jgi:hypothetical protein